MTSTNLRPTFTYHLPGTVEAASAILAETGGAATVLGGGTMAMPKLRDAAAHVDHRVIDTARIAGFSDLAADSAGLTMGAGVSYSTLLSNSLTPPLLRAVAGRITGGPQIRNQGTVGGSACQANPASDIPTALVALQATLTIARLGSKRTLPAGEFFLGPFRTDLRPGELLVALHVPATSATDWGYAKLKHGESSWPITVAAAQLTRGSDDTVVGAAITLGAATPTPVRIPLDRPEQFTTARKVGPALRTAIFGAIGDNCTDWWADEAADRDYRRRVAGVIACRAIDDALSKGSRS